MVDEKIKARDLSKMFRTIFDKNVEIFQDQLTSILLESISYHDTKENFYHGFLVGILSRMQTYRVKSNRETGNGRSDIYIRPAQGDGTCVIIEIKVAKNLKELDSKCDEALNQIENKGYAEELIEEGYKEVIRYGIAFYEKTCRIKTNYMKSSKDFKK